VAHPERWAVRGTSALGLLASALLIARAVSTSALSSEPAEIAAAGDAFVRLAALLAGALLIGLVLWPAAPRLAPWRRAAAGSLVVAAAALVALIRLDPWMSPRALVSNPTVSGASQLSAPASERSSVRIYSQRTQVEPLPKDRLAGWLAADPARVAIVWEHELPRVGSQAGLEQVARGYLGGTPAVVLRAAPVGSTPDRIR
jgi:hypothetical protein